jgi:hypothetical protein
MNLTGFSLKKLKDLENTGHSLFEKYQQNTLDKHKFSKEIQKNKSTILNKLQNFKFNLNPLENEGKSNKYKDMIKQEKIQYQNRAQLLTQTQKEN